MVFFLTTCCADLKETITDCCADLKDTITNLSIDINPVFTGLTDLQECCTTIGSTFDTVGLTSLLPTSTDVAAGNVNDFTVIEWLKAIYQRVGQLNGS